MTALLLTACVGMITGAFLIFRISPMDFTLGVFRRLTAGPKSIRDEINETTHRKKPGLFRREISEAQTVLQATGKEQQGCRAKHGKAFLLAGGLQDRLRF